MLKDNCISSDSILVIDKKGDIRRIYCPFKVICLVGFPDISKGGESIWGLEWMVYNNLTWPFCCDNFTSRIKSYNMKRLILSLLLIFILLSSLAQREQDSLALVALYKSTNGPNWDDNTNWLSSQPISNWSGILVDDERVLFINLGDNRLSGMIPSEISNLTKLKLLNLQRNDLKGTIPKEIGNLNNLTTLELSFNQITGHIPSEIAKMTNLSLLFLNNNKLKGFIPKEINLNNPHFFYDFSGNKLKGISTEKLKKDFPSN